MASNTAPQVTVTVTSPYKSSLARLAGCVIVSMLPDKSLPELLESLKIMWEFYAEEVKPSTAYRLIPQKAVEARIIGKDQRRSLVLSE